MYIGREVNKRALKSKSVKIFRVAAHLGNREWVINNTLTPQLVKVLFTAQNPEAGAKSSQYLYNMSLS